MLFLDLSRATFISNAILIKAFLSLHKMTAICVNPFRVTLNATNVPICVADWAHTQLQLVYATYAWIFLLCIAIAWTIVSRYQRKRLRKEEIGFSLKLRQWARTNRQALILVRPLPISSHSHSFVCVDAPHTITGILLDRLPRRPAMCFLSG